MYPNPGPGSSATIQYAVPATALPEGYEDTAVVLASRVGPSPTAYAYPVEVHGPRASGPAPVVMGEFPTVRYDVTDSCCQCLAIATCPVLCLALVPGVLGTKTVLLEPEEVVMKTNCCCYSRESRKPYGELPSVDHTSLCCVGGLSGLSSNLDAPSCLFPGWGCCGEDEAVVKPLVAELTARMRARGDTGNILKVEEGLRETRQMRAELHAARADINRLLAHFDLPPANYHQVAAPAPGPAHYGSTSMR